MKIRHLAVRLVGTLALVAFAIRPAGAQTPAPTPGTLSVFLDCGYRCDEEFLHTEITYVNWVRDRAVADVHILVTTESTGGGGTQFTLAFIGLRSFAGTRDTLRYNEAAGATRDETRRSLTRVIKTGLVRFLAHTTLADRLQITVSEATGTGDAKATQTTHDPWNFWTFTTSFNGNANGDRNNTFTFMNGSFNARRTTQAWKINLSARESYNQSDFTIDEATSTFIRRSYSFDQLAVKSLGPRLSAGWRSSVGSSTFENKRFSYSAMPAVEYDIFPYSESTRRMLTLQYAIGAEGFQYKEETIYGKLQETRPLHTLALNLSQNQQWGSANVGLEGGQYLDATERNYATLFVGTSVRVFKGLNVNLSGNYSAIRNQLYLPRTGATEQEILTQQRQLATSYQYFVFIGVNYTFGSVLNNIVNPRFGRDGGGIIFF